jgi:hypothetical protein
MLDKLLGLPAHKYLQVLGTFILAVGLPLNKVVMSIGTIWLAANLLLKADFQTYWRNWKKHPVAWFIAAILLVHIIGFFYSTDLSYAFRDLKTKLPLFVIPISLIGYPLIKRHIHLVLKAFLVSLLITSIINWLNMSTISNTGEIVSFRDVSLFGSHIRYGLLIVMGIVTSIYFFIKEPRLFFIWIPLTLWFVYYTAIGQVLGGYIALIFAFIAFIIYSIRKFKNPITKRVSLVVMLLLIVFGVFSITKYFTPNQRTVVFGNLPEYTEQGNRYYHDTTFLWFENGNHVMSFVSEVELKEEWEKRSDKPYDRVDSNGYKLKSVILRYMSSKSLTKDAEGMKKMTSEDIKNIEAGMTNVENNSNSPFKRFETLKNQIQNYADGGDPDGNSLLQRVEHWKAAIDIIEKNWVFGVGSGDVQAAFDESYLRNNSKLDPKHWNRAHNQFLTFWISFGVFGFLLFVIFWNYLFILFYSKKNLVGLCFTLIVIASFLSEDTIETQQGVTFIALFLGVSLGLNKERHSNEPLEEE